MRTALIGSAFVVASLGANLALADGETCTDDGATCPADLGADDSSITSLDADHAAQPTPVPPSSDIGTIGPPTVVQPFAPAPANAIAPQPAPMLIAPGDGADKQHLPPGPPNRALEP